MIETGFLLQWYSTPEVPVRAVGMVDKTPVTILVVGLEATAVFEQWIIVAVNQI